MARARRSNTSMNRKPVLSSRTLSWLHRMMALMSPWSALSSPWRKDLHWTFLASKEACVEGGAGRDERHPNTITHEKAADSGSDPKS